MRKTQILVVAVIMLLTSIPLAYISQGDDFYPQTNNIMGFSAWPSEHVTIGETFRYDIYGNISWPIDTIAADNMTFLPAGIVNYTSATFGTLLPISESVVALLPSGGGINNAEGYVASFVLSINSHLYPRINNTHDKAFNITWYAVKCGTVTFIITAGGTAANGIDYGTTKVQGTVHVHPMAPTGFSAVPSSPTSIYLSWALANGMSKTVICASKTTYPTLPTTDTIFNGTGVGITHTVSPGEKWYYSAWGWNDTAGYYSLSYDTGNATTPSGNNPPNSPTLIHPTNNALYQSVYNEYLKVHVIDIDGNTMSVSFYWNNGSLIHTITGVANNTDANLSIPSYVTPAWLKHKNQKTEGYSWYVNVSDGTATTKSTTWHFNNSYAWDINEDGTVNYLDASTLALNYRQTVTPGSIGSDINDDGTVNYVDASTFALYYRVSYPH